MNNAMVCDSVSVEGFKSMRELNGFEIKNLNVLIGGNGAGKSNFIELFQMAKALSQNNLARFVNERGGADDFLFNGPKITRAIKVQFDFTSSQNEAVAYRVRLTPTADERLSASEEGKRSGRARTSSRDGGEADPLRLARDAMSKWMVYHFHDTSATAPMRRSEIIEDHQFLRNDAANIAPFLRHLRETDHAVYREILNAVQLVAPFIDDFRLDVVKRGEKESVKLNWRQKGSDYPMQPYHLSDGSIRFICLATALLQPDPPPLTIIDEPELGQHPDAIAILAELIHDASNRAQIIAATQSPTLINHFAVEDIAVVNRKDGQSTFKRLSEKDFLVWLEDYSLGELWTKNVIVGGVVHE